MSLPIKYPVLMAPMAGGITDGTFAAEVSNYGFLGAIPAGNIPISKLEKEIISFKQKSDAPFQVNIFVIKEPHIDHHLIHKTTQQLQSIYENINHQHDEHLEKNFNYQPYPNVEAYVDCCIKHEVPVISFTFGVPEQHIIKKLKDKDIIIIGTATSVDEALSFEQAGADAVVCQGYEAGGHFAGFLNDQPVGLMALIPQVKDEVNIPVIAAGGITDQRGIKASIALGADYVQIGTRFLNTDEAIAHIQHKNMINASRETSTSYTKAFSGKNARGIENKMMKQFRNKDIPDYPIMNQMTGPIRNIAKETNNPDYMSLWSGQNIRTMTTRSLKQVLNELWPG